MNTLAEEIPFAAVVIDKALNAVCSSCFGMKTSDDGSLILSRCLGCRAVHYCSKECQKNDWVNHKHECHLLKNCSPDIPSMRCRLLARVIFKLEREDAHDAAFNGRRFEDLMDHRDDILKNPERITEFAAMSLCLHNYMGEKYIPKRNVLMSIFGKVYANLMRVGQPPCVLGAGLFIGLSAQNHSCDPDAHIVFDGSKAILRSFRMKEYSKDVTITYIDLPGTRSVRQEELRSKYYFTCTCSVCSDPTNDYLPNSARSTCCPDSYCLLDPNATELSCFKCGKPSKISVDEAICANRQISIILQKMGEEREFKIQDNGPRPTVHSHLVYAADVQMLIKVHEKYSKVLSRLNANLLRVTDKLFELAFILQDSPICWKYYPGIIQANKRYLAVGDPVLANRLLTTAMEAALEPPPTRKVLEILEEALATSILTFDPRHPHCLTAQLEMQIAAYRMALMNIGS